MKVSWLFGITWLSLGLHEMIYHISMAIDRQEAGQFIQLLVLCRPLELQNISPAKSDCAGVSP